MLTRDRCKLPASASPPRSILEYGSNNMEVAQSSRAREAELEMKLRMLEQQLAAGQKQTESIVGDSAKTILALVDKYASGLNIPAETRTKFTDLVSKSPDIWPILRGVEVAASKMNELEAANAAANQNLVVSEAMARAQTLAKQLGSAHRAGAPVTAPPPAPVAPNWQAAPAGAVDVAASGQNRSPFAGLVMPDILRDLGPPGNVGRVGQRGVIM